MSWFVEELLLNSETIKSEGDIDSEEFTDLLVVESCLDALKCSGEITSREYRWFNRYLMAESKEQNALHLISDKIANHLGEHYTDEGYLEYMKEKYKLSPEQVELLRSYMKSYLQHRVMNKPYRKELSRC